MHQSILAQAPKVNHTEHICLFLQYACNNTAAGWKITWESTTFGCQMANITGVPDVSEPMMCHRVGGAHQTESQIMMGLNRLYIRKYSFNDWMKNFLRNGDELLSRTEEMEDNKTSAESRIT